MLAPELRLAFTLHVLIAPPIDLGAIDSQVRRVIPICGGRVEGPLLSGTVLAGGADWQAIGADGVADIHARYVIMATDGTAISVDNRGIRHGPPAVMARLAAGEDIDSALYYFRSTPRFAVAPGPHRWLAETVFVGRGARYQDHVRIEVFAVS